MDNHWHCDIANWVRTEKVYKDPKADLVMEKLKFKVKNFKIKLLNNF